MILKYQNISKMELPLPLPKFTCTTQVIVYNVGDISAGPWIYANRRRTIQGPKNTVSSIRNYNATIFL